jgi:LysM repeat protein
MKWRHWAVLIVLVLLNYIIFSTAFTQLADQRRPKPRPTRTPQPTYASTEPGPVSWIVLPTSTLPPTRTPVTPTPTTPITSTAEITPTAELTATVESPATTPPPAPTDTPLPPTATPTTEPIVHTVKSGETLSQIAQQYGVSVEALIEANGLTNPGQIDVGQTLIIPAPSQVPPTASPSPQPTNTPQPAATKPPTPRPTKAPTPKPTNPPPPPTATPAKAGSRFTAQIIWDPLVAPNCSGPAISKQSVIQDTAGNPMNGVQVEVDCYGNVILSHASGTPGEYDPGHYDFAFGQDSPQDWTCTARVAYVDEQPVTSSEVVSIQFDTNDCDPHGSGHQVAIVNWTKHW